MNSNEDKLEPMTEFETKYLSNINMLYPFKQIASELPNLKSYRYAEGYDQFFENSSLPNTFVRFRRSGHPDENGKYYQQLTSKTKAAHATNNLQRREPNLAIPGTMAEVWAFVESVGFSYTHTVWKGCHIYQYDDCTLSFYSVRAGEQLEHFCEIEVDEQTIHGYSKMEAMAVIEKYETLLAAIEGVSARKRLKLSLRERYRKLTREVL